MKVRSTAKFRADFPDDTVEDEEDIIQYPGKGITEAIGEILTRLGCKVSEPIDAAEHGWELDAAIQGRRLWSQVTVTDEEVIFMFEDTSMLSGLFRRNSPVYVEVLKGLDAELRKDSRFHDIVWYAKDEFAFTPNPTGAPHPVDDPA